MKNALRVLVALVVVCVVGASPGLAAISASSNTSQPSQSTSYNIMGSGGSGTFAVNETVILDPLAGPWLKSLVNSGGGGISSGANRGILETLTNGGAAPWRAWHESVVSRTDIFNPNDSPGFLFRENSLSLMANYGAGFVPLTQGVDYTLVITPNSGPPGGGNGSNWEGIDIFFSPGAVIETGDVLQIQKDIFEVFGDSNVWQPGEAAVVSEFPLPEPASFVIAGMGIAATLLSRRRVPMN